MVRRRIHALADLYLLAVAGWATLWKLVGDATGFLGLLNAWAFWLLAPAIPIGFLRLRRRSSWLSAGWLFAGVAALASRYLATSVLGMPLRLSGARQATGTPRQDGALAQAQPITVLSHNVLMGNCEMDALASTIERASADLVLLQEIEPDVFAYLSARTGYPFVHYEAYRRRGGALAVLSRHPIRPSGVWAAPARSRPYALRVTVDLPTGMVDIYNVHLLSVGPSAMVRTGLSGNFRLREEQAQALVDLVHGRPYPALLLGDFNMTEGNDAYGLIAAGLVDAWRYVAGGLGWTWPRNRAVWGAPEKSARPVLRLDYCFCTPSVEPVKMEVLRHPTGSDHCPVVVKALLR